MLPDLRIGRPRRQTLLILLGATLALAAACAEPPRQNRALLFVGDLRDLTYWDRVNGGRGHDSYDGLLQLEPNDSVPVLIAHLADATPTRIDDRIHRIPVVGDVAFQLLLLIFGMRAEDFEPEGVWVGTDPAGDNPIYKVHLDTDEVRERVKRRFHYLARRRGWLEGGSAP